MKKKTFEVTQDLRCLITQGEISLDHTDYKYQRMFCNALEAIGMNYHLHVNESEGNAVVVKIMAEGSGIYENLHI